MYLLLMTEAKRDDDLVRRLKIESVVWSSICTFSDEDRIVLKELFVEAADEIERLRTQCQNWARTATEQSERISELRAKLETDERKPVPWDYKL